MDQRGLSFGCIFWMLFLSFTLPIFCQEGKSKVNNAPEFNMARSYFDNGQYEKAAEILNKFLLLHPESPNLREAFQFLMDSYEKTNQYTRAADVSLMLYRQSPLSEIGIQAYLRAAQIYLKQGRLAEGKRMLSYLMQEEFASFVRSEVSELWEGYHFSDLAEKSTER